MSQVAQRVEYLRALERYVYFHQSLTYAQTEIILRAARTRGDPLVSSTMWRRLIKIGRACKPDSPRRNGSKQVIWNQPGLAVNDVSFGSMDRIYVTRASQFLCGRIISLIISTLRTQLSLQSGWKSAPYELGMTGALYPVYVRGTALLALHNGTGAATEFRKILDHPGAVLSVPIGALAHLGLARAYALQGETVKAHAGYKDFFTLWKDADRDIPILKEANAEYAKVQ